MTTAEHSGAAGGWRRLEDRLLALVLAAMVALPVTELALRGLFRTGIVNAAAILQHLVLVLGMLGAMAAARDRRLLAFSGLQAVLPPRLAAGSDRFSAAAACGVCALLAVASGGFVLAEWKAGTLLAYGVPVWTVQAILPAGFAVIAWRIARRGRFGGGLPVLAAAAALAAPFPFLDPAAAGTAGVVLVALAALCGAPMFTVLGGIALALFAGEAIPLAAVPLSHYQLTTNPSLPAIPLFTLAGYVLAEGGAPQRLARLFQALFGPVRGGTALVSVLLTAFFTSFTGASGVTILALGGLLMPLLKGAHYTDRSALGLITSAPALGTLVPPALPLILYAIVSRQPIESLFLAGILPALVMIALLIAWGIWAGPRHERPEPFEPARVAAALAAAKWEVALPALAFASLMTGWVTPVETAALTAAYAVLVECVIHRDLKPGSDLPRLMAECGLLVGGILLILGMALGLTNYLTDAQVPDLATEWVGAHIESRWAFLLALNLLLLVIGMLMDIFSAIIVVTPIIAPIGAAFGIDPVHLGIVFLANMELGFLTPPVGMNLFFSSYRFAVPLPAVIRSVLPALGVLAAGVLLITYVPALSTWLPAQLR